MSGFYGGAIEDEDDKQQSHCACEPCAPVSEDVSYAGHDFNAYVRFRPNWLKLY
jgi:hypothetical protein